MTLPKTVEPTKILSLKCLKLFWRCEAIIDSFFTFDLFLVIKNNQYYATDMSLLYQVMCDIALFVCILWYTSAYF